LRKIFLTFLFLILAVSAFWLYRVRARAEAAEFSPAVNDIFVLRAGTTINAFLRNGIAKEAATGDSVTAFVSEPVMLGNEVVIPTEAELKGSLEQISVSHKRAELLIRFSVLVIRGQRFNIDARQVSVRVPIVSDIDELRASFETLMATTLGTSIGGGSGDPRLVKRGLLEGTKMLDTTGISIPIAVTLTKDLKVQAS
jgi:hypothetical protein